MYFNFHFNRAYNQHLVINKCGYYHIITTLLCGYYHIYLSNFVPISYIVLILSVFIITENGGFLTVVLVEKRLHAI